MKLSSGPLPLVLHAPLQITCLCHLSSLTVDCCKVPLKLLHLWTGPALFPQSPQHSSPNNPVDPLLNSLQFIHVFSVFFWGGGGVVVAQNCILYSRSYQNQNSDRILDRT